MNFMEAYVIHTLVPVLKKIVINFIRILFIGIIKMRGRVCVTSAIENMPCRMLKVFHCLGKHCSCLLHG
jgi:hypothetical protein